MLIIVCGLPGTGKSTLAKALARELSAVHLNTDTIRKKLFEKPEYTLEEKRKVYVEMKEQARMLLDKGENVILDATFFKKEFRDMMRRLSSDVYFVKCILPEEIVEKRLTERKEKMHDPSDADYRVYKEVEQEFEYIHGPFLDVDCTTIDQETIARVMRFIEGKG